MLDFEVIKRRESKTVVEKYDFPVLTICEEAQPLDGAQRAVQKFELNKAAAELLSFEDGVNYVGLAYMPVGDSRELVIVNFRGEDRWKMAKFNKDYSFNSKQMFNILHNELVFDRLVDNEYAVSHHIDEESGYEYLTLDRNLADDDVEVAPEERISMGDTVEEVEIIEENYL